MIYESSPLIGFDQTGNSFSDVYNYFWIHFLAYFLALPYLLESVFCRHKHYQNVIAKSSSDSLKQKSLVEKENKETKGQ